MKKKKYRAWLKAFSGLSINISAAWFTSAFIGSNISFPKTLIEFLQLLSSIAFGIMFLLATVVFEKEIEK